MISVNFRLRFQKGKQRELLQEFAAKQGILQKDFAKMLNVCRWTLQDWKREKFSIPEKVFQKLCNTYPDLKKFEKHIIFIIDIGFYKLYLLKN